MASGMADQRCINEMRVSELVDRQGDCFQMKGIELLSMNSSVLLEVGQEKVLFDRARHRT
jgi:hypothetical protein